MKLYIAEKPSLGRAIAEVLPRPHKKQEGFIRVGNGDCVSWCIGHLLEQAPPDAYDPRYKQWKLEHLPISPAQWILQPKTETKKQLGVLRKLVKQASAIIHAGDPDREGQLLVDEVLDFIALAASKRQAVQRCLISDLNPAAVQKALARLRPNSDFAPLSISALARARADWLYGMNMTRLCSIQGQKSGYSGVLSVGRVQTPILGLVVKRDKAIEDFVAKPYYEVWALLTTANGTTFKAKWQPSEACAPYRDEEGRVLSRALADNVISRIRGQIATVIAATTKHKTQAPPLPYSLSALQIDAAKRFGLKAKTVLDICQSLYEKHKLITYPRSDCRYLPEDQFADAQRVIAAIAHHCQHFSSPSASALHAHIDKADVNLPSKAWNDTKVSAHHAIIPTLKQSRGSHLSANEQNIYELIGRQYLAQFFPPWRYEDRRIDLTIAGGAFVAKARQTLAAGWKELFPGKNKAADDGSRDDEDIQSALPALTKGDTARCTDGERKDKMTQAPKPFTDATLLSAMTGIARFVNDPEIRKVLRDTDGLGTEATRAGIIELLFKRDYLIREGKNIRATATGKKLIAALPIATTRPDMTAHWESQLNAITRKEASYDQFMQGLTEALPSLMKQVPANAFQGLHGATPTRTRRSSKKRRVKATAKK